MSEKAKRSATPGDTPVSQPYQPTEAEKAMLERFDANQRRKDGARFKVTEDNELTIAHPDPYIGLISMMEAFGIEDRDVLTVLLGQISNINGRSEVNTEEVNFVLGIIEGIKPRDQLEAMLAIQMAAVHMASMTFARRLAKAESFQQQDSAERAFNKLTRTFPMQMETLKRYRSGGEQRITVQHVTVNDGGQAVVGNVTTGGKAEREGGHGKN